MANRVTESMKNITSAPRSRNSSAIVTAVKGASRRSIGAASEVQAITTDFCMPSRPNESVKNSPTSRPRSPIKAMTLTAAAGLLAIEPSNIDLPTPVPAKMPTRWPRPQVNKPSMAATPVSIGVSIGARSSGLGALATIGRRGPTGIG